MPVEKCLPQEKQLREKNLSLSGHVDELTAAMNNIGNGAAEADLAVVENLSDQLNKLKPEVDAHQEMLNQRNPIVSDSDLKKDVSELVSALAQQIDAKRAELNATKRIDDVTPELQIISQQLQQRADELPQDLSEQQSALEDLGLQKSRLEALIDSLPDNDQSEQLRQKSSWDLSRLKELLNQLGAKVGDKLAALAAFNSARKEAEQKLLDITSRPESDTSPEQAIEAWKQDEEAVQKLRDNVALTDYNALDEAEKKEMDDLIARLEKAQELIKVGYHYHRFVNVKLL